MADPFEVRLRFSSLLTHLTASTTSAQKTASYALKHRDMDEDLHSCILESLESPSTNMNSRANIMYFLEHFCDVSTRREGSGTATAAGTTAAAATTAGGAHEPYVAMIRRDIRPIVGAVVGSGKSVSGANIKVARKVVGDMGVKGYLEQGNVSAIERDLRMREEERARVLAEEAVTAAAGEQPGVETVQDEDRVQAGTRTVQSSARPTPRTGYGHGHGQGHARAGRLNGMSKVDKKAIEQRIEEDRERNKRLRESVWAVNGDDEEELNRLWEETSDLCEEDYALAREEMAERKQFANYHRTLLMEGAKG